MADAELISFLEKGYKDNMSSFKQHFKEFMEVPISSPRELEWVSKTVACTTLTYAVTSSWMTPWMETIALSVPFVGYVYGMRRLQELQRRVKEKQRKLKVAVQTLTEVDHLDKMGKELAVWGVRMQMKKCLNEKVDMLSDHRDVMDDMLSYCFISFLPWKNIYKYMGCLFALRDLSGMYCKKYDYEIWEEDWKRVEEWCSKL